MLVSLPIVGGDVVTYEGGSQAVNRNCTTLDSYQAILMENSNRSGHYDWVGKWAPATHRAAKEYILRNRIRAEEGKIPQQFDCFRSRLTQTGNGDRKHGRDVLGVL
jgi:hypothetical protein